MLGHRELCWKGDKLIVGSRNSGAKVLSDSNWLNMYRFEYQGVISEMGNLTRIRDAAISIVAYNLNHPAHKTPEKAIAEASGFANQRQPRDDSQQVQRTKGNFEIFSERFFCER